MGQKTQQNSLKLIEQQQLWELMYVVGLQRLVMFVISMW